MRDLSEEMRTRLGDNLDRVRERMAAAASRSGRAVEDVELVAVTKRHSVAVVRPLLALGVAAVGESRPEVLRTKAQAIGESAPWHLIGHFQRKKIAASLPWIRSIHSIHGTELMAAVETRLVVEGVAPGDGPEIFLQVNVSGEASKQGFRPDDVPDVVDLAGALTRCRLRGLMTMAPRDADERGLRGVFSELREIRDRLETPAPLDLSMGMSRDFEIAIEEGATHVRIGTDLFEGIPEDT